MLPAPFIHPQILKTLSPFRNMRVELENSKQTPGKIHETVIQSKPQE
jgi:hypothetical protein